MSLLKQITRLGVAMLLLVLIACSNGVPTSVVTGSGDVTTQTFEVANFSRLNFSTLGSLDIVTGERETLTVSAQPNIIEHLEASVSGSTLEIRSERNVSLIPTQDVRWTLTVRTLEQIDISGAGSVNAPELSGDGVTVNLSGAGDIDLEGIDANRLDVEITGLGNIDILGGRADEVRVTLTGAGSYDATEVQTQRATVTVSGTGSATVRVSEALEATISGVGNVRYIGSPQVTENVSGIGSIEQIGR